MRLLYNDRFAYPANGHAGLRGGTCWLRLYSDRTGLVAIVTELDSNRGPSITNAIESIARRVRELAGEIGLDPDRPLTLVEHYDEVISYGAESYAAARFTGTREPIRYSSVSFDERGVPTWMHLNYGDVLMLVAAAGLVDLPEHAG